jgi:hypothetical protein
MKKIVECSSVEGLELFLGERITLMCQMYFYTGKLVGVNDNFVKLEDAHIVFETGMFNNQDWEHAEKLPNDWYVMKSSIESFGILK